MKGKVVLIISLVVVVLLIVTGVIVYKALTKPLPRATTGSSVIQQEALPQVDSSISVDLVKSQTKDNTVVITAKGLSKDNIVSVAYELSYESQGLIKGVNSGGTPIDTGGTDTFTREIYLGTCSKNDCKPDVGVTKVSLVLEFTDKDGKKSQFSKDYPLGQSSGSGSTNSVSTTPPED